MTFFRLVGVWCRWKPTLRLPFIKLCADLQTGGLGRCHGHPETSWVHAILLPRLAKPAAAPLLMCLRAGGGFGDVWVGGLSAFASNQINFVGIRRSRIWKNENVRSPACLYRLASHGLVVVCSSSDYALAQLLFMQFHLVYILLVAFLCEAKFSMHL